MNPKLITRFSPLLGLSAFLLLVVSAPSVEAKKLKFSNPDFTNGDPIPKGATHDWTLGATGARGWIYSNQLSTSEARQIRITEVADDSPAKDVLKVGDVILGIGEAPFSSDARIVFAKALTAAESTAGKGELHLLRWRDGKKERVTLELPVLGDYSPTAPYDCAKSKAIFEQGCKALAEVMQESDYNPNPVMRSINGLALLSSGKKEYLPLLAREAKWAADFSANSFSTWFYGYNMMFLAEYIMATGDDSVLPGLRRIALESARGQSIVGSWGHKFAGKDGRLVGYGMMNAPGVPLTIALDLAHRAGVNDEEIPVAIERSTKLLRFYTGKGAISYGDHKPWTETHGSNGKNGMAAVLFNQLGEEEGAEFFSRMSLASHVAERDIGHTGNFWNIAWAIPGVALSGPQATGAWMEEFGSWYFDLARNHKGRFRHQGQPQPTPDSIGDWDVTGAYLLAYAMPLKSLMFTGKNPCCVPQLDAEQAQAIIEDGRGWTKADPNSFYDALSKDELMKRLGSWSPVVRERAAIALSRKEEKPVDEIIRLLDANDLESRLGSCEALAEFGSSAAPAVPKLRETLEAQQMWLRVKAAEALAAIGEPAKPVVPQILRMLAREPGPEDPRGMEQRYLCFALFHRSYGMLRDSLEGADWELLKAAVHTCLRNQDGEARRAILSVYENLSPEQTEELLPEIHYGVLNPSPSGVGASDYIRMGGAKILSKWKVEEGIDAILFYISNQNHWGSAKRVPVLLDYLRSYGAHAKRVIPELEKLEADFADGEEGFPLAQSKLKAESVRKAIEFLEKTEARPELKNVR